MRDLVGGLVAWSKFKGHQVYWGLHRGEVDELLLFAVHHPVRSQVMRGIVVDVDEAVYG